MNCKGRETVVIIAVSLLTWCTVLLCSRHGTGSLGHRVNGSFRSSFTSGSPGHHFDPMWDPSFFRFSKKRPKCKTYIWNADINTLTCLLSLSSTEYSIRYSTEYSSSKKLDSHTPTHKSTFGVHYRTGSPGQLGFRVAGSRVTGSQNVTQFHVWYQANRHICH